MFGNVILILLTAIVAVCGLDRVSLPKDDLSLKKKEITVLAMSNSDYPNGPYWWKWLIPSYFEDNLKTSTFGPKRDAWNDNSVCQLRFYAVGGTSNIKDYHAGGIATLKDISAKLHFLSNIHCYYMTSKDTWLE